MSYVPFECRQMHKNCEKKNQNIIVDFSVNQDGEKCLPNNKTAILVYLSVTCLFYFNSGIE